MPRRPNEGCSHETSRQVGVAATLTQFFFLRTGEDARSLRRASACNLIPRAAAVTTRRRRRHICPSPRLLVVTSLTCARVRGTVSFHVHDDRRRHTDSHAGGRLLYLFIRCQHHKRKRASSKLANVFFPNRLVTTDIRRQIIFSRYSYIIITC